MKLNNVYYKSFQIYKTYKHNYCTNEKIRTNHKKESLSKVFRIKRIIEFFKNLSLFAILKVNDYIFINIYYFLIAQITLLSIFVFFPFQRIYIYFVLSTNILRAIQINIKSVFYSWLREISCRIIIITCTVKCRIVYLSFAMHKRKVRLD